MKYTELVMVNRECDRKNRFFNIVGMTEDEIMAIINQYDKNIWMNIRR